MTSKATIGNYFEDLTTGLEIEHSVPRTVTEGDQSLYIALTADRYPLHCDAEFARSLGFQRETVNDLLVFHNVFGKSVPDISLNAVANLGYAEARFLAPVYVGDTLAARSVRVRPGTFIRYAPSTNTMSGCSSCTMPANVSMLKSKSPPTMLKLFPVTIKERTDGLNVWRRKIFGAKES